MALFVAKAFSSVPESSKRAARPLSVPGASNRACFGVSRAPKMYWRFGAFTAAADLPSSGPNDLTLMRLVTTPWLWRPSRRNLSCALGKVGVYVGLESAGKVAEDAVGLGGSKKIFIVIVLFETRH